MRAFGPTRARDLDFDDYEAAARVAVAVASGLSGSERVRRLKRARLLMTRLLRRLRGWYAGASNGRSTVGVAIARWRRAPEFRHVRGDAVETLPDGERDPWVEFWDDVDHLLEEITP